MFSKRSRTRIPRFHFRFFDFSPRPSPQHAGSIFSFCDPTVTCRLALAGQPVLVMHEDMGPTVEPDRVEYAS